MAYPTSALIRRVIKAAETSGLSIGGVRVEPDGAIVVFDKDAISVEDEYEKWAASRRV